MLLHHLPPNAQTDESHQAECLDTDSSACLHPAGEPEYNRMDTKRAEGRMTDLLKQISDYAPFQHKSEVNIADTRPNTSKHGTDVKKQNNL